MKTIKFIVEFSYDEEEAEQCETEVNSGLIKNCIESGLTDIGIEPSDVYVHDV